MSAVLAPASHDLDADAWRQAGLQAYANGQLAQAVDNLHQALRTDPLHAQALGDLAALTLEQGDADAALHWVRRALTLEPQDDAARYTCACALAQAGQGPAAVATLTGLVRSDGLATRNPELAAMALRQLRIWLGQEAEGDPGPAVLDPAQLSFRHRFDVLAKYLYARERLGLPLASVACDMRALYRRHIHLRTGGVEPGDEERKCSLAHYETQFDALIHDMAENGFRPQHAVPLSGEDGLPRNGAHRLAAALAVGCHVAVVQEPGPGGRWGYDWFRQHGFSRDECHALLRAWAAVKGEHAHVAVLWSPVEAAWPALEEAIDEIMPVVAARTLALPRAGFDEMVHDIYSHDWGARTGANIQRKVALLAAAPPRVRILFVERPAGADADLSRQLKDALREQCAPLSPVDHYTAVHLSESVAETGHLLGMFASENNLRWLRRRTALRPAMLARLDDLRTQMLERGIPPEDCCVVGGSVLDALGLRDADDLDFTLRAAPRLAHFDDGVTPLGDTLDVVCAGYARSFDDVPAPSDDELIDDPRYHFLVRGMRFADPSIVLARKQHQRRDKDLRDVALLADYLEPDDA